MPKPQATYEQASLVARIDAVLPQTQCTRCGYPSCLEYAQAIVNDNEAINRCPPGGEPGIEQLATLTSQQVQALDPLTGTSGPRLLAIIDNPACIGCTKCIRACPVDAIIGGPKAMHTVLPSLCSGCELCLPPCPVDCITMVSLGELAWQASDADAARERFQRRQARLNRVREQTHERHAEQAKRKLSTLRESPSSDPTDARKKAVLENVLKRARERQAKRAPKGASK